MMRLSELRRLGDNLDVVKDCDIDALGMVTTKYSDEKVLTFLADDKFLSLALENPNISALILSRHMISSLDKLIGKGIIVSETPKETFFRLHNQLAEQDFYWSRFENVIAATASVSKDAIIGCHSVSIGENTLIEPNVVIHPGCIIGRNVVIRSGSQIGSHGFQFLVNGELVTAVKTAGRVIIEDDVEVQHNCCIDRGVFGGDTVLKRDVKLDNFVHIAHDDIIGERTLITAGVKLAGRVTVGKDCWIGVNASVSNGITIGDNCTISLGAVVTKDVSSNLTVSGNFAIDHNRFIEFIKTIR